MSICGKVFGGSSQETRSIHPTVISENETQIAYGVPIIFHITYILNILKIFIIPVIVIVGLFTYYKKSKDSKFKKRIIVVISIIIISIFYLLLELYGG